MAGRPRTSRLERPLPDSSGATQTEWPNDDERHFLSEAERFRREMEAFDAIHQSRFQINHFIIQQSLDSDDLRYITDGMSKAVSAAQLIAKEPGLGLLTYRRFLEDAENFVSTLAELKGEIQKKSVDEEARSAVMQQIEENLLYLDKHVRTIQEKLELERKDPLKRGLPSQHAQLESEAKILGARLRDLPREDRARVVEHFLSEAKHVPALSFFLNSVSSLPAHPPEKWIVPSKGRRPAHVKVEKVTDFIKRVYSAWYGRGLTRQHLTKIDPELSTSLRNWERLHPEDALHDLPQNKNDFLVSWFRENLPEDQVRDVANALFTRVLRGPESNGPK
jgi:hypothetical protein